MSPRARRITLRLAAALIVLLIGDQIVNWAILGDGWVAGRRIAPFDPPLFTAVQQETLARLERGDASLGDVAFDPDLGWAQRPGTEGVDWCGARIGSAPVPRRKPDRVTRIATYGCSFTYGSEVEGAAAWPAVVDARSEDRDVLNLGVPGFGPDQALLRMRQTIDNTQADEVWLGFLPATSLRTLSIYRPALRHYTVTLAVKPRFKLTDDDALELVANPASSVSDLVALIQTPTRFAAVVADDAFMARWPSAYAVHGSRPAHWFATSRVLLTILERGGRDWQPRLADPTDDARVLTRALITTMAREAAAAGKRFRLIVLPDREALSVLGREQDRPWNGLITDLASDGVEVTDVSEALITAGAVKDDAMWAPNGHYGVEANRVVAEAVLR